MNFEMYRGILERGLVKSVENLNLPLGWRFQQDNDSKQTARATRALFQEREIDSLELLS